MKIRSSRAPRRRAACGRCTRPASATWTSPIAMNCIINVIGIISISISIIIIIMSVASIAMIIIEVVMLCLVLLL